MSYRIYSLLGAFTVFFMGSCDTEMAEPLPDFKSLVKSTAIVEANNAFAFSLFNEIASEETEVNYMISPVSASLALGMMYNGAEGETKTAFEDTFNYGTASLEEVNSVNQGIMKQLTDDSSGAVFDIANSLWIRNDFPVKRSFVDLNQKYYDAEVRNMDFSDPETKDIINNWVATKTRDKIEKVIEGSIPSELVMYAINALYFKSDWKYTFKEEDTHDLPFYPENSVAENVPMMRMTQDLDYFSNEDFQSVRLPYKNDKYNMMVFLPNADRTIVDLVTEMNVETWATWLKAYTEQQIAFTMPKFKYSFDTEFSNALINMGLGVAFSDGANFSGLSDDSTKISFVKQKTFIEVNEKGTEAAAVTTVGATNSVSGALGFTLDKPFLFVITEKETNAICFIGKVGMPALE